MGFPAVKSTLTLLFLKSPKKGIFKIGLFRQPYGGTKYQTFFNRESNCFYIFTDITAVGNLRDDEGDLYLVFSYVYP